LTIDDLPEAYREVADLIGIQATVALSKNLGGTYFYFPKLDKFLSHVRDAKIRKEFNGSNHKDLARKYNLFETWIRKILDDRLDLNRPGLFANPN